MSKKDRLFEIADRQQGYFTARQAQECGFSRSNFHLKIRSGEWLKEQRGIYKLSHYPITYRPELVLWTLWSQNKQGSPQGVWSHETALDIYELGDVMPAKMHLTVPIGFRRQSKIPAHLQLHFAVLSDSEIEKRQGYLVTTPLRSLIDISVEGKMPEDQMIHVIQEALKKGIISRREFICTSQLVKYKDACNF